VFCFRKTHTASNADELERWKSKVAPVEHKHSNFEIEKTLINPVAAHRTTSDEDTSSVTNPLVFISHDSRDAELAEAFSKLLRSVSAGMIKSFSSSDKKAGEGIDFGDEWYKRLMERLQVTSDVVCLFTERSLDRPWLLFEAGVAKGKLNTPVVGIALGVPLNRVTTGPFYQFQNLESGEDDLTKLVQQLARRIPGLELDSDVVRDQVKAFKASEAKILKALVGPSKTGIEKAEEESPFAKVIEEMKTLPSRVAERLADGSEFPFKRKRLRRFHPKMLDEFMFGVGESPDPIIILVVASLVKDDMPWLYEIATEIYRAAKDGNGELVQSELKRMVRLSETIIRGPMMDLSPGGIESHMFMMEFPHMLERTVSRFLDAVSQAAHRKSMNEPVDEIMRRRSMRMNKDGDFPLAE
jgi:hypothetical protein